MLPQGARLTLEYISKADEQMLLERLEKEPWYGALDRKVIHYGSQYRYFGSEPKRAVAAIPSWIPQVTVGEKNMSNFFNQVIVNAYDIGRGISPHIDDIKQFGCTIATLSLGSAYVMDLTQGEHKKSILLPRRSLLVLQDASRYKWKHGIAKRKHDIIPGTSYKSNRSRRISITYRCDLHQKSSSPTGIVQNVSASSTSNLKEVVALIIDTNKDEHENEPNTSIVPLPTVIDQHNARVSSSEEIVASVDTNQNEHEKGVTRNETSDVVVVETRKRPRSACGINATIP